MRSLPNSEQISFVVEGHTATIDISTVGAELSVAFNKPTLPVGVRINESSIWGPQLQEAWTSGHAIQTGDIEFDLAFIVLGDRPGALPRAENARQISSALKACLLELRPQLRDAEICANYIKLPIRVASERSLPSELGANDRFAWMVADIFLGLGAIPSGSQLEAGLEQGMLAVQAIEQTCNAAIS